MMYLQAFPYFSFVPFLLSAAKVKKRYVKSRHIWKKSVKICGEQSQAANSRA